MHTVVTIVDGEFAPADLAASWRALFDAPGEYVVAKASPADVAPQGDFETWFLRMLYDRTREHFVSAQYAMWETLDALLRAHGVHAPSELDLWELNRTVFDLTGASTARMVGLRIPPNVLERLRALGFTPAEALDFPAVAYRMGLVYQRLQAAQPMHWSELNRLVTERPLASAEREALQAMRQRGGVWMRPIFDASMQVQTAERELAPLRRIGSDAIANRTGTRAAARELANSQRARGIIRDAERVIRTEMAECRSRGVWMSEGKGLGPEQLMYRQTGGSPCRTCLRLYVNPDGTPTLYKRADLERWSQTVNTGPREEWTPKIGPTHPSCVCPPWSMFQPELLPLFQKFAPANRALLAEFGVHQEAA